MLTSLRSEHARATHLGARQTPLLMQKCDCMFVWLRSTSALELPMPVKVWKKTVATARGEGNRMACTVRGVGIRVARTYCRVKRSD